ncbi:MAG: amidase domain-containing protein [Lachnospiraceae bacterium]|nr:amidase domain-containing protein [Lachnospiraceae bacterium]
MLIEYSLNVAREIEYAGKWAFSRNPAYYNFDKLGGDCTNFISQCLYAGGAVMNYTPDTGWYYGSLNNRAAAWTGVAYFYRFMLQNKKAGPYGRTVPVSEAQPGDIIQLGNSAVFYHSLLVIDIRHGEPYIATHTYDAFDRPLSSYQYQQSRCIHIIGARKYV